MKMRRLLKIKMLNWGLKLDFYFDGISMMHVSSEERNILKYC